LELDFIFLMNHTQNSDSQFYLGAEPKWLPRFLIKELTRINCGQRESFVS
jgi:hypothetical protein